MFEYKFGNAEIVTIVKENVALSGIVGQDGVTTYNDTNLGRVARQELTIRLPQKMYVADVRSGRQLGFTDVIHINFGRDALVFGLTAEQREIKLDGVATAKRGEHISLNVSSATQGAGLVRCHVFGPDGSRSTIYSRNVLIQNGRGTFTLPFALNDLTGKYVIRSTDVVTGATFEKTIELR